MRIQLILGKKTGHTHPNTASIIKNYLVILRDLKLPAAEQQAKLEGIARDAGLTEAETTALLAPLFPPAR